MFDIGFSEIIVIAVVGLVVIGPERLPRVARTVGTLLGRAQRYFQDVKNEVNRELRVDELRRMQEQAMAEVRGIDSGINEEARRIGDALSGVSRDLDQAATTVQDSLSAPVVIGATSVTHAGTPPSHPDTSTPA